MLHKLHESVLLRQTETQVRMPVILITGCSSGLGRALAKAFQLRGFQVFASARKTSKLHDLKLEGIETVALDVNDPNSVRQAVDYVVQQAGTIDYLICNSGIIRIGPVIELDVSDIHDVLQTNVTGAVICAQAVAPIMIKQRSGVIAVTGSVSATLTTPYAGLYSASKSAVHSFFRALRMELAPFNISVSIIEAGGFKSSLVDNNSLDMNKYNNSKSFYARVAGKILHRAQLSQGPSSHPAEYVARQIADQLCRKQPRGQFTVAGNALYYKLCGLLQLFVWPSLIERQLCKMFGLQGRW